MLLHLVQWLTEPGFCPGLDKITLRAVAAAVASFVLALALGPRLIAWLERRFREPIKKVSPQLFELHQSKQATPTMGGLFIVAGIVVGMLVLCDWRNPYPPIALLATLGLAVVGAVDDLTKLRTAGRGISAGVKLSGQCAVAVVVALLVYRIHSGMDHGLDLVVPGATAQLSLGWLFVPLAAIVIVASSNAVNLTDGLDGLAGGCLVFATAAMAAIIYAAGHSGWAAYLGVPFISGAGEMVVMAGAVLGGVLGFLWFNCHPASVFMGDTGSLPLGGLLGLMAVIARQELLLVVVAGVFVAEALSVILQVGSYRWRRQRIFLCSPLHHHFQFLGWPEGKIVVRFWIAGALCAVVGLAGLKLRAHEPADPSTAPIVARHTGNRAQ